MATENYIHCAHPLWWMWCDAHPTDIYQLVKHVINLQHLFSNSFNITWWIQQAFNSTWFSFNPSLNHFPFLFYLLYLILQPAWWSWFVFSSFFFNFTIPLVDNTLRSWSTNRSISICIILILITYNIYLIWSNTSVKLIWYISLASKTFHIQITTNWHLLHQIH